MGRYVNGNPVNIRFKSDLAQGAADSAGLGIVFDLSILNRVYNFP